MTRRELFLGASMLALVPLAAQANTTLTYSPGLPEARLAAGETVLIDVSAPWCGTCRAQGRAIDDLRAMNPPMMRPSPSSAWIGTPTAGRLRPKPRGAAAIHPDPDAGQRHPRHDRRRYADRQHPEPNGSGAGLGRPPRGDDRYVVDGPRGVGAGNGLDLQGHGVARLIEPDPHGIGARRAAPCDHRIRSVERGGAFYDALAVDADREPVRPVIIGKVQVERDTHLRRI
jgi:hypothetical protein